MAVLGALLLLSHLSPPPGLLQAPGPRTAPALAPGRAPGAAFVEGSRIPLEAEAQGPVQCGSSPPHQPHGPTGAPSWGSSQALVFPFPLLGQRPGLSNEEGKEALLSLAWERGAPGRAQEAAEHRAHPEVSPLHVAISTSAGPGLCPGWLQPWFPSAALGSAGVGAQPSILGAGRAVPHGAAPAAVAWTSLWFRLGQDGSVVVFHNTNTTIPSAFLVSSAGASDLFLGAAAG